MSQDGGQNSILLLYVFHAPADTVEGEDEGECSPETQEGAEEGKMKEQVAYIREVLLFIRVLESLSRNQATLRRNKRQKISSSKGFINDSTMQTQK